MGEIIIVDIDFLARRILELKEQWRQSFNEDLLQFKWSVGKEMSVSRVECNSLTYTELEAQTGIARVELWRCLQFYEKYPNQEYQLKAWRKHIKELPFIANSETVVSSESDYRLIYGAIEEKESEIESNSIDVIITDPPYSKEHIPDYESLAKMAKRVLKDGGSLIVMTGQSYLLEILKILSNHLAYNWIVAYLTPGGQSAQLWERKVNTFWKPVLWFVKGGYDGGWIGDVSKSAVNDNDKRYSEYGQSESGMFDLVKRFSNKGDIILDPFMGAGTTGVAALKLGCRFIGIDCDAEMVKIAEMRLTEVVSTAKN